MTLEEARKTIEEIQERYDIKFSDYQEERRNGEIKMVCVTLKFKVDHKILDFSGKSGIIKTES